MNQGRDDFWARFQEISDRRQDPFEDADIVEYLERHPDLLQETATIRQTSMDLGSGRATSRRRPVMLAAAALIIIAIGIGLIMDAMSASDSLAGESRIISFRMRLESGTPLNRQILVHDGSAVRHRETKIQEWRFPQRTLSPRTDRLLSFHASRTIQ